MVRRVIVLGGGSAGFLTAMTLKRKLPELAVTVIRSKAIGIIGVGEGTTVAIPKHLHGYLGLDQAEFYRHTEPTWKFGIRFIWGRRPFFDYTFGVQTDWKWSNLSKGNGFYCDDEFTHADVPSALMSHNKAFVRQPNGDPLIGRDFGYHIENEKFVAYLESKLHEFGVTVRDDTVSEVTQADHGVTGLRLASGEAATADLYVDCSGFRSELLGRALGEPFESYKSSLFCDRAVAGSWTRTTEPVQPYTTSESMACGWCWQIEHLDRIIRGYVYSSDFISDADAETEFRAKCPKVDRTRVAKFTSGRYARPWVGNVVAIGNASGFVEPLEATALAVICDQSRLLTESLTECDRDPTPSLATAYNRIVTREWDTIRYFLGLHYKFNDRYDNEFWRASRDSVDIGRAQQLVDYYRENGPSTYARSTLLVNNDIFGMEGYLCMLVGMKEPYRRTARPTPAEWRIWNGVRAEHRAKALTGLSVPQAWAAIQSPSWSWNPDFFK